MLEAYTSEHPETVDEVLDWPAKRAEAFLDAFQNRKLVEDLNWRRLAHVNALFANSNYAGEDGARERDQAVKELDRKFEELIGTVYEGPDEEDSVDMDDPFFAHAYDGLPPLFVDGEEQIEGA